MTNTSMERHKLIHDAAAGADELVLRLLTKLRQLDAIDSAVRNVEKSVSAGNFYSGRRTQAGTNRDLSVNERVRSGELVSSVFKVHSNTHHVITPGLRRTQGVFRQVYLAGLVEIVGSNDKFCIWPWGK